MSFTPVAVETTRLNPDGSAPAGTITFTLVAEMLNGTTLVQPSPIVGVFNPAGQLVQQDLQSAIVLLANDDSGTTPADPTSAYRVVEQLAGTELVSYVVYVLHAATITETDGAATVDSSVVQLNDVIASSAMLGHTFSGPGFADGTTVLSVTQSANTVTVSNASTETVTGATYVIGGGVDLSTLAQYAEPPELVAYIPWVPGDAAGDILSWDATTGAWVSSSVTPGGVDSVTAADSSVTVDNDDPANPTISAAVQLVAAVASAVGTANGYTDEQISELSASITAAFLQLTGGTLTGDLDVQADVTIDSGGQLVANDGSTAKMRMGQKSNSEIVWSYNVDQNNSDAIDDPTASAFKFSMQGTEGGGYDGLHLQYAPPDAPGGWGDSSTVFTLDGSGDVWIAGTFDTDGGLAADLDMNGQRLQNLSQAGEDGQAVEYAQWQAALVDCIQSLTSEDGSVSLTPDGTNVDLSVADTVATTLSSAETFATDADAVVLSSAETFATDADSVVLSDAETFATSAVAVETSRAEAAEATLQPKMETQSVQTVSFVAASNLVYPVSTASGPVTVTLPATPADEDRVTIKTVILGGSTGTGWNTTTIAANTGQKINIAGGSTTTTSHTQKNQSTMLQWVESGSYWIILSDDQPTSAVTAIAKAASGALLSNDLAVLGDSITGYYTFGYQIVLASAKCYLTWAMATSGQVVNPIFVDGDGGSGVCDSTFPQRVTNAIATGAPTIMLELGTNDVASSIPASSIIYGTANGMTTYATGCGLLPAILNITAAGARVIINTIPPRDALTSTQQKVRDQVNSWIREQASIPGVTVVDAAAVLTDTNTVGLPGCYLQTALDTISGAVTSASSSIGLDTPLTAAQAASLPVGMSVGVGAVANTSASLLNFWINTQPVAGATSLAVTFYSGGGTAAIHSMVNIANYSDDGVHPNHAGSVAWGIELGKAFTKLFPTRKTPPTIESSYNFFPNTATAFVQSGGTIQNPAGTGFPTSFDGVHVNWASAGTEPAGVSISYVPSFDGVPGNWCVISVPNGETGTLNIPAGQYTDGSSAYAGDPVSIELEVKFFGNDSTYSQAALSTNTVQGIRAYLANSVVPSASAGYQLIAFNGYDPCPLPESFTLKTPAYLQTQIANLGTGSGPYTGAGTYTTIPLAHPTYCDLAAGESIFVSKGTTSATEAGQFCTVSTFTPAGSMSIPINAQTFGAGYTAGFVCRTVPTPAARFDWQPDTPLVLGQSIAASTAFPGGTVIDLLADATFAWPAGGYFTIVDGSGHYQGLTLQSAMNPGDATITVSAFTTAAGTNFVSGDAMSCGIRQACYLFLVLNGGGNYAIRRTAIAPIQ